MARDFTGGSVYLQASKALVSRYPITMCAWARAASAHTGAVFAEYGGVTASFFRLMFHSGGQIRFQMKNDAGTTSTAASGSNYTANKWHHVAGRSNGAGSNHHGFIDGVPGTVLNLTISTPYTNTLTTIGSQDGSVQMFNGHVEDAVIYAAELDDDEIRALSLGVSPLQIRPWAIAWYHNLRSMNGWSHGRELLFTRTGSVPISGTRPVLRATPTQFDRSQLPAPPAPPSESRLLTLLGAGT